jgi:uncharacterized protein
MRVVRVTDTTSGIVIGDRIKVADTSLSRMFGLLGKHELTAGEGLWINPSSGVHTVGMRFVIDVIGLDKDLRVVKLWQRLIPFRVTSINLKIRSVIELEAGKIEACKVEVGDLFQISKSP